jgi:hypothetical protein
MALVNVSISEKRTNKNLLTPVGNRTVILVSCHSLATIPLGGYSGIRVG